MDKIYFITFFSISASQSYTFQQNTLYSSSEYKVCRITRPAKMYTEAQIAMLLIHILKPMSNRSLFKLIISDQKLIKFKQMFVYIRAF